MLGSLYNFSLNQPVVEGLVALARFDGDKPNLVCGTVGGKVFVHTPHEGAFEGNSGDSVKFLNINKNIVAITAGSFEPKSQKDILVVSSQNNIIAYGIFIDIDSFKDVEKNSDLFYKDVTDGANALAFGYSSGSSKPLLIVGGNCSILGFDDQAEEQFWTVTGDNVSALCFCDMDEDGQPELIVGSDDFAIRIFKAENILYEINEASRITLLNSIADGYFAFSLDNGTIGVYKHKNRLWRVKAKHKVISILTVEAEKGVYCLIVGWSNGRVEVRNSVSGEILYNTTLNSSVAKILKGDYRLDGTSQIIVVTVDGTVRGYSFNYEMRGMKDDARPTSNNQSETLYNDLVKKKNELLMQISLLNESKKGNKTKTSDISIIPSGTKLVTYFRHNSVRKCPELVLQTNNTAIVRSAIIFAEQIFLNESAIYSPLNSSNTLAFPLKFNKNAAVNLNIKALVGNSGNSTTYQVFEIIKKMPKFCNFMLVSSPNSMGVPLPNSVLTIYIKERVPRFVRWMSQCFIIDEKTQEGLEKQEVLDISFVNLYDSKPLILNIHTQTEGKVLIRTDNMEVASELVQDLCSFMNISDLESHAEFPQEMEELKGLIKKVSDYNDARLHLVADMAEAIRNAKTFVVKAEDARILGDMKQMKKMYSNLYIENRNLVGELLKRNTNHEALVSSLKQINNMINKASNLRYGNFKTKVVTLCRNAIKSNNIFALVQIMQTGKEN